jgi:hypothetical protein
MRTVAAAHEAHLGEVVRGALVEVGRGFGVGRATEPTLERGEELGHRDSWGGVGRRDAPILSAGRAEIVTSL